MHPVNSQATRSSVLTQVTATVVETAAVVLACVHALKLRKKEKCEQFFHFFRPDSSRFLQLFLSLGQVGFPPPIHREVTSSAQSGKAGGGFGELDVHKAQIWILNQLRL